MFLKEIFEHVLGEHAHNLSEVFRHMYLTNMAYDICQTLFGDICLYLWNECFQGFAVRNRFGKELVAFLYTLLLGEPFILALDEHPASISQVHGNDRSYHDTLADIVFDGRKTKPFSYLALKSVGVFETFTKCTSEQSPGIEESMLLEKVVHLIYRQIPTTFLVDDIDVKTVELVQKGAATSSKRMRSVEIHGRVRRSPQFRRP